MFLKSKKHSMESGKIISWKAEIYIMDFNLLTSIHKTPDEQWFCHTKGLVCKEIYFLS